MGLLGLCLLIAVITQAVKKWAAENEPWRDAKEGLIRSGDVLVRVVDVQVREAEVFRLWDDNLDGYSTDTLLHIKLGIRCADPTRLVVYEGLVAWGRRPSLSDSFGNDYAPTRFGAGLIGGGQRNKAVTMNPDAEYYDTLIFDRPVAAADHLNLQVPASAWGADGHLKIAGAHRITRGVRTWQTSNRPSSEGGAGRARCRRRRTASGCDWT
jgi:hypothetical protein